MASTLKEEYRVKRRVTWVSAVLNLLLAGLKLVLGYVGHSQALIADGIHSLSDLVSDAMVLVVIRIAREDADDQHPYGHARFETVATLVLGLLLLLVAAGIVFDAAERIAGPGVLTSPGYLALSGAALSILVKEWMFWYNLHAARKLDSELMRANAWHHRSDAISSVIVLIGIGGSMAGYPVLDAVGAIGVSLLIGKIGWSLAWSGARELVDTGATAEQRAEISAAIGSVDGVEAFHELKTRRMGKALLVDVHVLVGSQVTVSEGHMTADRVRAALQSRLEYVSDVLVHVDPEDDEDGDTIRLLPGREEMLRRLERRWQDAGIAVAVERVDFHYLGGVIDLEIRVPLDAVNDLGEARHLSRQIAEATRNERHIGEVSVVFV